MTREAAGVRALEYTMDTEKYIIFGVGKIFEEYGRGLALHHIVAYSANKRSADMYFGKPFLAPDELPGQSFDYVVIFSTRYFDEIYRQLIHEIEIPAEKVISFLDLVHPDTGTFRRKVMNGINRLMMQKDLKSVLDIYGSISDLYFSKDAVFGLGADAIRMDLFSRTGQKKFPIFVNLYDREVLWGQKYASKEYDVVIAAFLSDAHQPTEIFQILSECSIRPRYAILTIPYPYGSEKRNWFQTDFSRLGEILAEVYYEDQKLVLIDLGNFPKKELKVYVAGHKPFTLPSGPLYREIYVGEYGRNHQYEKSDSLNDNISGYNEAINEMTALYWIWKNAREDYVGLNHYRRYFLMGEEPDIKNILNVSFANQLLSHYDMILPREIFVGNRDIKTQLQSTVDPKAFREGWEVITKYLMERQPDYLDAFEYVFCGEKMYPCNMFVTKKSIIDKYCRWLFCFILDAARAVNIASYDDYSKRIIGFFAERLFNVWLMKQNLKIKELPILFLE